jgi:hypothetical protein
MAKVTFKSVVLGFVVEFFCFHIIPAWKICPQTEITVSLLLNVLA